jgi:hypothetical protein
MGLLYVSASDISGSGHPIVEPLSDNRLTTAAGQIEDRVNHWLEDKGVTTPLTGSDITEDLKKAVIALTLAQLLRDYGWGPSAYEPKEEEGMGNLKTFAAGLLAERERDQGTLVRNRARLYGHRVDGDEIGNESSERLEY